MRILVTLYFLFLSSFAFAQQLDPFIISTAGEQSTGSGIVIDWTIGEIAIQSYLTNSILLTEGFHQPKLIITSIEEPLLSNISIYPNPTSSTINITIHENQVSNFQLELINTNGKIIWNENYKEEILKVSKHLNHLSAGIYYLKITVDDRYKSQHKITLIRK